MIINDFQDVWHRWHDKKCPDGRPSSNNGWIYTAYAHVAGVDTLLYYDLLIMCINESALGPFPRLLRSPQKELPPMSRDEILGMVHLRLLHYSWLVQNKWNFCNIANFKVKPWYKINYLKVLSSLIYLAGKHRNTMWQEKGHEELWQIAFRLPVQDQYYVMVKNGLNPGWFRRIWWCLSTLYTEKFGSDSGKLLLWFKYMSLGWFVQARSMKISDAAKRYFVAGHPIRMAITGEK